jgi:hypothetical protein
MKRIVYYVDVGSIPKEKVIECLNKIKQEIGIKTISETPLIGTDIILPTFV